MESRSFVISSKDPPIMLGGSSRDPPDITGGGGIEPEISINLNIMQANKGIISTSDFGFTSTNSCQSL